MEPRTMFKNLSDAELIAEYKHCYEASGRNIRSASLLMALGFLISAICLFAPLETPMLFSLLLGMLILLIAALVCFRKSRTYLFPLPYIRVELQSRGVAPTLGKRQKN